MREVRPLELQAAFGLLPGAARFACLGLSGTEGLFRLRQKAVFLFLLALRLYGALFRRPGAGRPHVQGLRELRALLAPGAELRPALGVLAFQPGARFLSIAK